MYVCEFGSLGLVELLLLKNPDIINQRNNYRDNGFIRACMGNNSEVAKKLFIRNPDPIK